jgi:hypothetical protein
MAQMGRDSSDKMPDLDELTKDCVILRDDSEDEDEHDDEDEDEDSEDEGEVVFLDSIAVPEAPHLKVYAKLTGSDSPLVYRLTGYLQDCSNGGDTTVCVAGGFVNEAGSAWIGAGAEENREPSFHAVDDEDQDVGVACVVLFDHKGAVRPTLHEALGIDSSSDSGSSHDQSAALPVASASDPPPAPTTSASAAAAPPAKSSASKLHAGWQPDGVLYFSTLTMEHSDDTEVTTLNALRVIRGITYMLARDGMIEMAVISPREHPTIAPHAQEDKAMEELLQALDKGDSGGDSGSDDGDDGEQGDDEGDDEGDEEQSNQLAELREHYTTRVARQLMRVGFKQCARFPSECHYSFWVSGQQQQQQQQGVEEQDDGMLGTLEDWTIAPVDTVADAVVHLAPRDGRPCKEDKVLIDAVSGELVLGWSCCCVFIRPFVSLVFFWLTC